MLALFSTLPSKQATASCGLKYLPLLMPIRYFARCWLKPQSVTREAREEAMDGVRRRLALLATSETSILEASAVLGLERSLSVLFEEDYPQVLTHGDLSRTNILVDEGTYEITGIIDWSLAAILPFGMELDCLFLMTGYMDRNGWHDFACRPQLYETFWTEFWSASGVQDSERQGIRDLAERAARIGAILRYALRRNPDGSPSEALASEEALTWKYLQSWFAG
jgi:Ser/Thr protein kinase RdoA (MazF antagonist)